MQISDLSTDTLVWKLQNCIVSVAVWTYADAQKLTNFVFTQVSYINVWTVFLKVFYVCLYDIVQLR